MQQDDYPTPADVRKLKIIYGWYIYVIYALLIFNIYLTVYNICARQPIDTPLFSAAHSMFIAFLLYQVLKKKTLFAWIMTAYFIGMRLYYANVLHAEFSVVMTGLVFIIVTMLLAGNMVVGQLTTPQIRRGWLFKLGWRQAMLLIIIAALVTRLITTDYLA
ncbi:hypothetical protein ACQKDS_10805 [Serratia sp. NPDC078593]|uniref:hypothetical protein n=1 Tax=unclassified Serratia (in: enterobacteria) TaxID=2647522 RepID=UPI0037D37D93